MNAENKIKTAFDSVGASESLKAATKSFLQEARRKEERRAAGHRLRMAAQAVCAAVLHRAGAEPNRQSDLRESLQRGRRENP